MAGVNAKGCIAVAAVVSLILNVAVGVFLLKTFTRGSSKSPEMMRRNDFKQLLDVAIKYELPTNSQLHKRDGHNNTAQPTLEFLNLLKPIAHVSGLHLHVEDEFKGDRNGTVSVRTWTTPAVSYGTYLHNGMNYGYGSIIVPVAGVYHITSHVKFYVEDNKKDAKSPQTFHHQIARYSASSRKQVVLFENVVTEDREGINDGAHFEYPSLTGGLAQLDAGDQVIVKVSHFDPLKFYRDWHYFDIYLI